MKINLFPNLPGLIALGILLISAIGTSSRLSAQQNVPTNTPTITSTATSTSTPTETFTPTGTALFNPGNVGALIVAQLQADGVVPNGGRMLFELHQSFASASSPGYSFLSIGKSQHAQNFALGFQIYPTAQSVKAACGMIFRASADDWHSILVSTGGQLSISHQHGATQTIIYTQAVSTQWLSRISQHSMILIAQGSAYTLYLNGIPSATFNEDGDSSDGVFSMEVFNPTEINTITYCNYVNIWGYTFDQMTDTPTASPTITTTPTSSPTP